MWCYCDMKVLLVRSSAMWLLYAVLAALLFAVTVWACVAVIVFAFLSAIFLVAREWWKASRHERRRSGMAESRLPQTDDYVPGTLTLRTARVPVLHDRRR